ncbi:MAG: hypothetical protein P8X89_08075 [Reinekea sp.]
MACALRRYGVTDSRPLSATLATRASLTALPVAPSTAPNGTNVSASSAADFAKPAPSPSYPLPVAGTDRDDGQFGEENTHDNGHGEDRFQVARVTPAAYIRQAPQNAGLSGGF